MLESGTNGTIDSPLTLTDVEKGAAYEIESPELLENLITPEEAEHEGLAAASKPLILFEKIAVSLLVVCLVMVEAYFVGVSFREWLDQQNRENSTNIVSRSGEFMMPVQLQVPIVSFDVSTRDAIPEPFEDFEGGVNAEETTVRVFNALTKPRGSGFVDLVYDTHESYETRDNAVSSGDGAPKDDSPKFDD